LEVDFRSTEQITFNRRICDRISSVEVKKVFVVLIVVTVSVGNVHEVLGTRLSFLQLPDRLDTKVFNVLNRNMVSDLPDTIDEVNVSRNNIGRRISRKKPFGVFVARRNDCISGSRCERRNRQRRKKAKSFDHLDC
jgi:hypothetical protein